jgi:ABC-type branched-subunit amino acid transport system ATPase component
MLEVRGLDAGYQGIKVLREVSFSVADGQVMGVLGRNGMGKSTLIRALSGLIIPTEGSLVLDGEDLTALPPHRRAQLGLTTVIQERGIFPKLTVRENLEMGRIASGRVTRNRMDEVFEYFPRLEERLEQVAGTLSGGEQQMLAIGRGIMTDPKIMLLDEPSDGIMPTLVTQIAERLLEINRRNGMSIIIVEQNVPMVFSMTEDCLIIEKGRIVASGKRDAVADSEIMRQYLAI